jgi:hypothetical protein
MEVLIDKVFGLFFLPIYGLWTTTRVYHHEDPLYSQASTQTGERTLDADLVQAGDLVLCSGGSMLDYVYLTFTYSPTFCTIAKGETDAEVLFGSTAVSPH